MGLEAITLAAYMARFRTGTAAALLALLLFLDNLVSLLNHRLLMAIELLLLSLRPVPASAAAAGFRRHRLYWSLDLVRWQVSAVYLFSALHKATPHFLSGEDLRNLFWQIEGEEVANTSRVSYRPAATVRAKMSLALVAIVSGPMGRPIFWAT